MSRLKILYLTLLLNGTLLGSQYLLINRSLAEISVLGLSALRLMFSTIFMLMVVAITGGWREFARTKPVAQCLLLALLGEIIAPLTIAYSSLSLSSSIVGLGVSMAPFITLVFSSLIFEDEKLSVRKSIALVAGFAGATLLYLPAIAIGKIDNAWEICSLAVGAIALGFVNIIGRTITGISALTASTLANLWGFLFVIPVYFVIENRTASMPALSLCTWGYIGILGIAINAVSTLLFLWLAKEGGASFVSYVGFIIPCVAVILGVSTGEQISVQTVLSLGFIVAGLGLLKPKRSAFS